MIRGQKRALDKRPSVNVNLNASIHNRFDIEVVDAKTGEIKQRANAKNVICNQMWTRLLSSSRSNRKWINYIHYGNGDGTPSTTDTSLFSFVGAIECPSFPTIQKVDAATGVFSVSFKVSLGTAVAVGSTLSEVGIGYSNTRSTLCTHAMLTDMNGNKISITKTDTDILNIYATVFLHFNPDGYQNGDVRIHNVSPTESLLAKLAMGFGSFDFGVSDFAAVPAYGPFGGPCSKHITQSTYYTPTTPVFDVQNKRISMPFTRIESTKLNIDGGYGGIYIDKALSVRAGGEAIPPTRVTGEAVGTGDGATVDFSTKFGFAHDAVVYVDGVQVQDVTVENIPKCNTEMGRYFIRINEDGSYYGTGYCADGGLIVGTKKPVYFENPHHEFGIASVNRVNSYIEIYGSNDLKEWVSIKPTSGNGPILAGHEYDRYIKFVNTHGSSSSIDTPKNFVAKDFTAYNIHFGTPPAAGAAITIDYTSDTAAKDENHVFDFSLTIQLGEFNPNA